MSRLGFALHGGCRHDLFSCSTKSRAGNVNIATTLRSAARLWYVGAWLFGVLEYTVPTSGAMESGEQPSKQNHYLLVFHLFPPSHRPLRGSFPPAETSKRGEGQPMLDRSVASAAAPVLVFPHNIEIGRAGKGGKGGGKSCWVSVVFIFLACASARRTQDTHGPLWPERNKRKTHTSFPQESVPVRRKVGEKSSPENGQLF